MDRQTKTITYIDGLKGIGILFVVIAHLNLSNFPSKVEKILDFGGQFVCLFFLISSFLICLSIDKHINNEYTIKKHIIWIINNVKRLLFPYFLSVIIGLVLGGKSYWLGLNNTITFPNVLTHLLFINEFYPFYANSIIGVEWYIGVLIEMYLFVPIVFYKIKNFEDAIINCSVGFLLSTIVCHFAYLLVKDLQYSDILISFVTKQNIIAQYPSISLGILLYYLHKNIKFNAKNKVLSFVLLMISFVILIGCALSKNNLFGLNNNCIISLGFFILVLSQNKYNSRIFDNVIFCSLGRYSLYIYLFHFYLCDLLPRVFSNIYFQLLFELILIVLCTFSFGYILNKLNKKIIELMNNIR